ncbi:MAG: transposase [Actinobacteria bacterium]|nr:transposase [Actinomycetota bacterium]
MAYNFLAPERDQLYLLPPSVTDWLPEDHLAFFILDAVEEMDLSAFYGDYRHDGWGGAAHHPKAMVALLVYAYCLGVRSSRQIERACQVDVAFRVICAGLFPDHATIARFRSRHEQALKGLFSASLRLCSRAGMAKVGLVALDGTKMAAAASMQANRTKETIDAEVEKMFAEAAATDDAEDAQFGTERGDEPPATLRGREDRRRRFARAKQLLDAELAAERAAHEAHLARRVAKEAEGGKKLRGRKPKAPKDRAGHKEPKANTTDPESKLMSTSNGFVQGYNAQAAANEEQVIVAAEVTDERNDSHQLHPMIEATAASLAEAGIEERPERLLADAGYASEENFAALDAEDPDAFVATRNMKNNPKPRTGRRGPLRTDASLVERMDRKVSRKAGRALYRRRQQLIEPVFGQIKDVRGIRRFMRRGKAAADSEWKLICGTHNLLKLYRRARLDPSVVPFSRIAAGVTC